MHRYPRMVLAALAATAFCTLAAAAQPDASDKHTDSYRPLPAKVLLAGIDEGALASPAAGQARQWEMSTSRATSYIYGVADTTKGTAWCPPAKMTMADLAAVTYPYLTELPAKRLDEPAAAVVTEALKAAYPCKR